MQDNIKERWKHAGEGILDARKILHEMKPSNFYDAILESKMILLTRI